MVVWGTSWDYEAPSRTTYRLMNEETKINKDCLLVVR